MYMTVRLKQLRIIIISAMIVVVSSVLPAVMVIPGIIRSDAETESITLPIIMYHGLVREQNRQNKYFISPDLFENDIIYLQEHGYHPIFISELISHIDRNTPLPDKPIIITFDDGYLNNYTYAFPLLKKYRIKAVISPIGCEVEKQDNDPYRSPAYSQCSRSELKEMSDSGYVEIQNHTYNMHQFSPRKGAGKTGGESDDEYLSALVSDLKKEDDLINSCTGKLPCAFVCPFGVKNDLMISQVRKLGYRTVLDCEEKLNNIFCEDDLFCLHRFLRPENTSSQEYFARILPE